MPEVKERIELVLDDLRKTGDIEASAVVRRDGLMISSDLPARVESRTVAAMAAALVGTAETTSSELKRGAFQEVVVDSEKGKIVAIGAGKMALLVSLMRPEGNLGFVLLSMERAAKSIESILGEG
ncbi:Roadblock/LC7 domain protein [uncultured archaeon]|nr:Roadblock/LC7 domain protein [uncultured archaeon]